MVKNPPADAGDTGDLGLIPGSGRSPEGGHGNPFQYSCLENPMDRGAWQATVHRVTNSWTQLKWLSMHAYRYISLQPNIEKLYTISKNKTGSWLWLRSWTPCFQIQLKWKKVGKTTRPFRDDLNQIPYDYTVEVRNRFKGLDLIDRVPGDYGMRFMTLYRRQGSRPSPRKRNAKKQNGCLRRPYK